MLFCVDKTSASYIPIRRAYIPGPARRGLFPTFLDAETIHSAQAQSTNQAQLEATAANEAEAANFNAAETDFVSPGGVLLRRGFFGGGFALDKGHSSGVGTIGSAAHGVATPFVADTTSDIGMFGAAHGWDTALARGRGSGGTPIVPLAPLGMTAGIW